MRGGAELPHASPTYRNVGRGAEIIILHSRMGGHCVVTHNDPAYLGAEMVEDGPAGGRVFLDDELEQLHGGVGQASSGFDNKEDG